MKQYFHFKIQGSRIKSPVLLTTAGLGDYKQQINTANQNLQNNRTPLMCTSILTDVKPVTKINDGYIIVNPNSLPKNMEYFEFLSVDDLMTIYPYKKAIELQRKIDRLQFQPPRQKILKIAEEIQLAEDCQDIPGRTFDTLMYQLWCRNEELITGLIGYSYESPDNTTPKPKE